jgi:hypothetical protein
MSETSESRRGPELWSAPNQQVVRPDHSAPWDEGDGGSTEAAPTPTGLDAMTKAELLEHAQGLGVKPANATMSKDELRAAIDEHGGE